MNKQLQRDLQCSIQSLKPYQLSNVLVHYQQLCSSQCQKSINKKGMNYECEINFKNQISKGFGRNQQQSLSNATKNLLSNFVGKNIDIDAITKSLKYKNGKQQPEQFQKELKYKYLSSQKQKTNQKQQSLILDDISMIQANSRIQYFQMENNNKRRNRDHKNDSCDCVFYQMHQYQHNEIKHLQARVNLLTEQNMLLKKMLMCGTIKQNQNHYHKKNELSQKQNSSYQANSVSCLNESKMKL